jgi:hypothetical protein
VAGTFVDNLWERVHPARLPPGMAALHQQKVRALKTLYLFDERGFVTYNTLTQVMGTVFHNTQQV